MKKSGHCGIESIFVLLIFGMFLGVCFTSGTHLIKNTNHFHWLGYILYVPIGIFALFFIIMFLLWLGFAFMALGWKLTKWKCFDPGDSSLGGKRTWL